MSQDSKLVAAGLVVVAILVALGLLLSATVGPQSLGSYSAMPVIALIGILFLVAVAAAVAEVRQSGGRTWKA